MINKIFQSSNLCLRKKETSARGTPRCFDVCYLSRKSRSFFGGLDSLYSLEFKVCGCALRVFLPTTYSFNCFWSIFFSYRFVFLLLLLFRGGRLPMDMLSKTQKVKNVDMKLLPPPIILSTSRADSSDFRSPFRVLRSRLPVLHFSNMRLAEFSITMHTLDFL